jgi:hypothetical protein
MAETKHKELDKVQPSEFYLTILGKKRQIKFGNLALAKIERKYGSISNLDELQKDFSEHPMTTLPWILRITMKDQEGIGEEDDEILDAIDESNISTSKVFGVLMEAMKSSFAELGDEKKTIPTVKKK